MSNINTKVIKKANEFTECDTYVNNFNNKLYFNKNAKCINKSLKIKQITVIIAIFCTIFAIIINPAKYIESARRGVFLWGNNVLPSLFPFMCLTKILVEILPKNNCKPSLYVFSLSVLSGYPISSKLLADYFEKGQISTDYVKKVFSYSSTSGPIFVIGTIGVLFLNNALIGIAIFLVHILSALLTGFIFGGFKKDSSINIGQTNKENNSDILVDSIFSSISSILLVGAYIMLFYVFFDVICSTKIIDVISFLLTKMGVNKELSFGLFSGIIELTRGAYELSNVGGILSICTIAFLVSFSGFCIILQSYTFLKPTGVRFSYILSVKLIHAFISFFLMFPVCFILNL